MRTTGRCSGEGGSVGDKPIHEVATESRLVAFHSIRPFPRPAHRVTKPLCFTALTQPLGVKFGSLNLKVVSEVPQSLDGIRLGRIRDHVRKSRNVWPSWDSAGQW